MPDDDEVIELRALQERAYGRGGGLTAAEAERLDRLTRRPAAQAVEGAPSGAAAPPQMISGVPDDVGRPDREPAASPLPASEPPALPAPPASGGDALRSSHSAPPLDRWRPLLIGIAAALVVGVGVGWFLFGRGGADAVALTAAQQEWQREIIGEATYDQGSLRAVAVEAGVVLWVATKKDGDFTCLLLGDGSRTTSECDTTKAVRESGLYGTLMVERGEGQTEVSAQMLLTAGGEPAVASSSYEYDPEAMMSTYATEEEERFAETLVTAGYDARSISVVGYDGETPIWTAARPEESAQCLIYGASEVFGDVHCADPASGDGLWVEHVDPATAQTTRVEWQLTSNYGANLVITRESGLDRGAAGE
ncbi:hypothetical protein [Microbacterium sp. NPDC087591]|uniref:hypothetical protein n=1 Tax=Microbacterium sp. NPDC087591 TaxID=3364192 RepID=UPI0037F187C3